MARRTYASTSYTVTIIVFFFAIIVAVILFLALSNGGGGGDNGGNGGNGDIDHRNLSRFDSNKLLAIGSVGGLFIADPSGNGSSTTSSVDNAMVFKFVKNPRNNYASTLIYQAFKDRGLIVDSSGDVRYLTAESTATTPLPVLKKVSASTSVQDSWEITSDGKNLYFVGSSSPLYLVISNGSVTLTTNRAQATEINLVTVQWTG